MKLQMFQDNKITNWILKACSFQIKSGTSPFYNQMRKYYDKNYAISNKFDYGWFSEFQSHGETLYDCFKREIKGLNWYETKLIDLKYYQNYTYTQLNKEFGLPLSTLKSEYEEVFEKIRKACSHC
jgi:DNA-directed RNA polymerase specialized sigma24 family protein